MNEYLASFLFAILPLVWLFIALGVVKMKGEIACFIALLATSFLAVLRWDMPFSHLITAILEGVLFALWPILIVIVAAVFTYQVVRHTGALDVIVSALAGISTDQRVLVLLIGWCFGGFLESIAGFGTPIAIPAGILWGMGMDPFVAAVACIVANIAPTPFGGMSLLTTTLAELTALNSSQLALGILLQLVIPILITPFVMVLIVSQGEKRPFQGMGKIALVAGLSFLLPQFLVLKYMGPELMALVASLFSLVLTGYVAKRRGDETVSPIYDKGDSIQKFQAEHAPAFSGGLLFACLPFGLALLFFLFTTNLFPALSGWLSSVTTQLTVYAGPNPALLKIQWLISPGVLLFTATFLGGRIQGVSFSQLFRLLRESICQMIPTILTLVSVVGMAKVISYSGMITSISSVIVWLAGGFYPYFAPVVGALGGFVTGSATSSCVLFGPMQGNAAAALGLSRYTLTSANAVGASIGKVVSPQTLATVTSTTKTRGQEGKLLLAALPWISGYLILSCVLSGWSRWILPF